MVADGALGPVIDASASLNASFRPPSRPSGTAPGALRPSGQPEGERPAQVDGGAHHLQLGVVARRAEVAHATVAVGPLHRPEHALDPGPDRGRRLVEGRLPRPERPVAPGPVHDPRLDPAPAQAGPPLRAVVVSTGCEASSVWGGEFFPLGGG